MHYHLNCIRKFNGAVNIGWYQRLPRVQCIFICACNDNVNNSVNMCILSIKVCACVCYLFPFSLLLFTEIIKNQMVQHRLRSAMKICPLKR